MMRPSEHRSFRSILDYGKFDPRLLEMIPTELIDLARRKDACSKALRWLCTKKRSWLNLLMERSEYAAWATVHMNHHVPKWFVVFYCNMCDCLTCKSDLRNRAKKYSKRKKS